MPRSVHQFQLSFFILTGKNEVFLCHAAESIAWQPWNPWDSLHGSPASGRDEPPHSWSGPENSILHCKSKNVLGYSSVSTSNQHPMNSNPILRFYRLFANKHSNICNVDCQNLCVYVPIVQTKQMQIVDPYRFMMVHGYT